MVGVALRRTGPYQLSLVKRGSLYQLTANPHYHGSKPHFKTVNLTSFRA